MNDIAVPLREIRLQVPPSNVLTLTNVPAIEPEYFVKWAKIDILKLSPGIVALDYFQDDRVAVVTYKNTELRNKAAEIAAMTIPSEVKLTKGYYELLPNATTPEYIGKLKTGLTPKIEQNKKEIKQPEAIKSPLNKQSNVKAATTTTTQAVQPEETNNIINNENEMLSDNLKYPNAINISKYAWINKVLSFFVYIKFMLMNRINEIRKNIPDMSLLISNLLSLINDYKYEFIIGVIFIIGLIILRFVVLK